MESTAGVPHVQISRVASIIATRLCDYLASPAFEAQTLVGTKTRLVIQGHLQSSTSVNQRIIDLVIYALIEVSSPHAYGP